MKYNAQIFYHAPYIQERGNVRMKKRKKQTEVFCPYCGRRAVLRPITYVVGENRRIFDPDQMVYVCSVYPACNAYVAANKKNLRPLGSLADGELRNLRIQAHRALRSLWQNGYLSEKDAYHWLSGKLGLTEKDTHIAKFSHYRCKETIRCCEAYIEERREFEKMGRRMTKSRKEGSHDTKGNRT